MVATEGKRQQPHSLFLRAHRAWRTRVKEWLTIKRRDKK